MKFVLEAVATARATTGSQEFADFFNSKGIGTYSGQIIPLQLTQLDPDLTGFEGGFPANTSSSKYHGYLIPFHNGRVILFLCTEISRHDDLTVFAMAGVLWEVGACGLKEYGRRRRMSCKLPPRILFKRKHSSARPGLLS